jgi:pilus assembly protein CpaF
MLGMAGVEIPLKALREIASAINIVIQGQRMSDGRRKVVSIQEIIGIEGDTITMQELFKFERTGMDSDGNVTGRHHPTGIRPKFMKRAEEYGIQVLGDLFKSA